MKLQKEIKNSTKKVKNLNQIAKNTILILKKCKIDEAKRIGYVAGIVTSDGPENIDKNVKNLTKFTNKIRERNSFPIFSSTDVFSKKCIAKLDEMNLPPEKIEVEFWKFWRKLLRSGYITDIFMTPGWDRSLGAQDEHKTAKKAGLKIHYLLKDGGDTNV
jgi:hypothetical protein